VAAAQGRPRSELDSDRAFQLVVRSLLTITGEAARRVSEATRVREPAIPWAAIIGTRNRIVHGYDEVDNDIVWQILTRDLPLLVQRLEGLLGAGGD